MNFHQYESLLKRPLRAKVHALERNNRLKHVIFAQQFTLDLLNHLGRLADTIRELSQSKEGGSFLTSLLAHKRGMLYFTQTSTRTFLSFHAACQQLGLQCGEIRDPSLSSEFKGEHPLDSMRMFSSYFDLIIMRSKVPSLAECAAYMMNELDDFHQRNIPIVNGGSGADEHPTQALLDFYTIQRTFSFKARTDSSSRTRFDDLRRKYPSLTKGLDGKTYCFCGDVGRGRTVRSLTQLLALNKNVTMIFVTPQHEKLALPSEMRDDLLSAGVKVEQSENLNDVISQVDLLYMTRIQHEHDSEQDKAFFRDLDFSQFRLSNVMLDNMKEYAAILHPFPRNEEIPFDIDSDPRAMYFRQARNGIWSRSALIAYLFDVDTVIRSFHADLYSKFHDYNEDRI